MFDFRVKILITQLRQKQGILYKYNFWSSFKIIFL